MTGADKKDIIKKVCVTFFRVGSFENGKDRENVKVWNLCKSSRIIVL